MKGGEEVREASNLGGNPVHLYQESNTLGVMVCRKTEEF
jgi:hypothetical protein